jgi:hypothetical protein
MPFKQSLLSDEAPRLGKAPSACWLLLEARGWFALTVDQSTDGCGGGGSSARRNQGTACLEDSESAWSRLTRPNPPQAADPAWRRCLHIPPVARDRCCGSFGMNVRSFTLSLMLLVLVCGCASRSLHVTEGDGGIRPGDCVVVELPGQSTPDIRRVVDADGDLSLPFVGTLHVGGMTLPALRQAILAAYHRSWPPEPEVSALRRR